MIIDFVKKPHFNELIPQVKLHCNSFQYPLISYLTVPEGGRGVFVKKGKISKGQVACLYPGLVYKPYHPILIASIRNAYIFRCSDGTMVDGKNNGLSG